MNDTVETGNAEGVAGVRTESSWLANSASEAFACLTTTGRRTGRPRRVEMWFAVDDDHLFLMAGGRERSDWVRNIQANPRVTIEVGGENRAGVACILGPGTPKDRLARDVLAATYATLADLLEDWKRRSHLIEAASPGLT